MIIKTQEIKLNVKKKTIKKTLGYQLPSMRKGFFLYAYDNIPRNELRVMFRTPYPKYIYHDNKPLAKLRDYLEEYEVLVVPYDQNNKKIPFNSIDMAGRVGNIINANFIKTKKIRKYPSPEELLIICEALEIEIKKIWYKP